MTATATTRAAKDGHQNANTQDWQALCLSTGFHLSEMVSSVLAFVADTPERHAAVSRVLSLLQESCNEASRWRAEIEVLGGLLREHPDAYKESGTWYDGAPSILALAAAYEAATLAMLKLYPSSYSENELAARGYKLLKYVLRALVQQPDAAVSCLQWIERSISLPPADSLQPAN